MSKIRKKQSLHFDSQEASIWLGCNGEINYEGEQQLHLKSETF